MKNQRTAIEIVRGKKVKVFFPVKGAARAVSGPISVKITTFAGLQDLEPYIRCLQRGNSSQYCYREGDNGRGAWGDLTAQIKTPMVAISPQAMINRWGSTAKARGKIVRVEFRHFSFRAEVRDKGPAGVCDLNPACLEAIGLPIDTQLSERGTFQWVD